MPSISLSQFRQAANSVQQSAGASSGSASVEEGRQLENQAKRLAIQKAQAEQDQTDSPDPIGSSLLSDIQSATQSGQFSATGESGKKTREDLINLLGTKFASKLKPEQVAAAVYGTYRNQNEGGFDASKYIAGATQKSAPATDAQNKESGFATRATGANEILKGLQPTVTSGNALTQFLAKSAPNFLKPAANQQQDQAERDFVNAVLRNESGAAISDSEFKNARLQYFPQPGDSPQVLAQKQANRATAIQSLVQGAGSAYQPTAAPTKPTPDPLGIR